jgi:hypothetical protein
LGKQVMEDGGSDVVREVAENKSLCHPFLLAKGANINPKDIRGDDFHAGFVLEFLLKSLCELPVNFDGDDPARALGQQSGHGATPRADFNDHVPGLQGEFLQNSIAIPVVMKEMLAELGWMASAFGFQLLDFGFSLIFVAS